MATVGLFNKAEIARFMQRFKDRETLVEKELSKAINKAARESINLSIAEWKAFSTNPDYIKPRLYIASGATPGRFEARIQARTRATRADRFNFRSLGRGKGVHLNVRRGRPGDTLKHAFVIPRAKSNNRPLILERLKKYQKGESRDFTGGRFKAVYGPSINQHFHDSRERVAPQAMSAAKQQFLKAIGA